MLGGAASARSGDWDLFTHTCSACLQQRDTAGVQRRRRGEAREGNKKEDQGLAWLSGLSAWETHRLDRRIAWRSERNAATGALASTEHNSSNPSSARMAPL